MFRNEAIIKRSNKFNMTINNNSMKTVFFSMIKNGVNPISSHYWGNISNYSQTIVEMFPIIHYCARNNEAFQRYFTKEEKLNVGKWFYQINNVEVCDNNWHFFPILVNLFLDKLGCEYNKEIIEKSWKRIDCMYLSNGWYTDGNSQQRDYYISFAFHFYSLLYAYYSDDTRRKDIIKQRADEFAKSYIYFFASSGEAIPFGRSLTYKFAHIAFWSIYSNFVTDRDLLGIIKGIINRNLRWWLKQHIFDNNGLLVNGYAYENPYMLEQYNGTGSPYWAFKGFYFMLDRNSLFFEIKEKEYPEVAQNICIPEAYINIRHCNGHSYAFVNGQSNRYFCNKTAKYEKFVYSTLFGFSVSRSFETLEMLAPDNTLAVKIGNEIMVRNNAVTIYNDEHIQISDWHPAPNITIRSFIIIGTPWHTRIHHVISNVDLILFDCGYTTNASNSSSKDIKDKEIKICCEKKISGAITYNGNVNILKCAPCTNILFPNSEMPYIFYDHSIGCKTYISSFYGNTKDYNERPNFKSIKIKSKCIYIMGEEYPLPRTTFYYKLFFAFNHLCKFIKKVLYILSYKQ